MFNGKLKALTFSYDDGVTQDKRLVDLFNKYGMKATFNFNCEYTRKTNFTKEEINEYFLSKGHEIAVHGANHRATGNLRPTEGIAEVLDCRRELEDTFDGIIRGMAYPDTGITLIGNGCTYERIKSYLTDLGIAYARTLGGDNNSFRLPEDFHAWMPTAHHNNPKIMEYIDEFLAIDTSTKTYYPKRYPRLFYIWGHSYEFDRNGNWDHMERICKRFSEAEGVWFATNIEIYDYVQAYNSLIFSADSRRVYNPTATAVWIDVDGRCVRIGAGERVTLE